MGGRGLKCLLLNLGKNADAVPQKVLDNSSPSEFFGKERDAQG